MSDTSQTIENQWIALSDGRKLAARVWLPEGVGPFPSILEYLPYRKRDGTAPRDATTHPVFASAGYACIRVDIAGTGDSEGRFDDEYSEQELRDGEEVLNWITRQAWCNGRIGMIGISWGGFNGLQLAWRRPEALKAIVTVASTADRYADDIHYMDGCLLTDNFNWSSQMFAYLSRPADPLLRTDWRDDWIKRMDEMPFMAAEWMGHPNRDNYWKHGSVCEDWTRINIPVLAITGWADCYVNTPPLLVENLSSPTKALIGPWEHRYAHLSKIDPADFHSEVIEWFDRWLKGIGNGADALPDYRVFMQEHGNPTSQNSPPTGRWVAEQTWPSPHVAEKAFHLQDGQLWETPATGSTTVSTPAHVGMAAGYFCPGMRVNNELAGDQAADDAISRCFDTAALATPLELLGRARLKVSFTVDRPVAQICARLCDISPEGVSQRIAYRCFNLTHHRSHETPEELVPGQVYDAEIELNQCAHRLRRNHRLRLALSTNYWPIVWPSPDDVTITLDLARCQLLVPVRSVETEIDPAAPGKPLDFPAPRNKELRAPSSRSQGGLRDDGSYHVVTFDDYGKTRDQDHGLVVGSHVSQHYAIDPDTPQSARQTAEWVFTFERDDWCVEITTKSTMTCDRNHFYLHREINATQGVSKTPVLTREWAETVPRGFL